MKRVFGAIIAALVVGMAGVADARSHAAFHGHGFVGSHRGPRVFVGGSVFVDPFFPYWYPYWPPYPYPVYGYPPAPPPEEGDWTAAAEEQRSAEGGAPEPSAEEERSASYGLVQLQGVRDGASVDLDGRFWLTADALEQRWLALPEGTHTITVRARGAKPVERRVDVKPGSTRVVRFPG
jgi:hypothetical protein